MSAKSISNIGCQFILYFICFIVMLSLGGGGPNKIIINNIDKPIWMDKKENLQSYAQFTLSIFIIKVEVIVNDKQEIICPPGWDNTIIVYK